MKVFITVSMHKIHEDIMAVNGIFSTREKAQDAIAFYIRNGLATVSHRILDRNLDEVYKK